MLTRIVSARGRRRLNRIEGGACGDTKKKEGEALRSLALITNTWYRLLRPDRIPNQHALDEFGRNRPAILLVDRRLHDQGAFFPLRNR